MSANHTISEADRVCRYECGSRCCRYITVVLPPPRRKWDFDEVSWFLAHESTSVYVEGRRWHLEVHTPCKYLTSDNLCLTYENRPEVCREYDYGSCEYPERSEHSLHFDTREAFETWLSKRREEQQQKRRQRELRAWRGLVPEAALGTR